METKVPLSRIRPGNGQSICPDGRWVIYWMTAFRRLSSNFALQYARDWAKQLQRPLLILEGLRSDYQWASDRMHRFVLEGMRDNKAGCSQAGVSYYPYVEPIRGAGSGLLRALAAESCIIVGDDFPCFFHPDMYRSLQGKLTCRIDLVDSNCLIPLSLADRTFTVAHSYRRWMQKELPDHLNDFPEQAPLAQEKIRSLPQLPELPQHITNRWPVADLDSLLAPGGLSGLPIDHSVRPVGDVPGGAFQAQKRLAQFIRQRLSDYDQARNEPNRSGSSELSPFLHFGQISCHDFFSAIMDSQAWKIGDLGKPNGKVNGFWQVSESAEAVLDQLCTWREIGFNMCWRESNYAQYESLPNWAKQTLRNHEKDVRPALYTLEQFEQAQTHDKLWNAAQRQLLKQGRIHNYLRMLWGKKILHWTETPRRALEIMIELNNKYALDGRDPNSYSGIFWVLGRYDRAWGPEREVFGKIRYMTSENTARKHAVGDYMHRFSSSEG